MRHAHGLHLIVTCNKRKTAAAGSRVYPVAKDAGSAFEAWRKVLAQSSSNCQRRVKSGSSATWVEDPLSHRW